MKKLLTTLALIFMVQLVSLAQTKKPNTTKKTVTPKTPPTATKPTTTATRPVPVAPAATAPAVVEPTPAPKVVEPTPQEQQNRQELYDKYHGTAPKPATPTNNSKSKSAEPANSRFSSRQEMSRATEYDTKSSRESSFKIGFRGGVNLANFGEAGKISTQGVESVPAFHAGLVFNIGGKTFSVQPEVLFSQVGTKIAASGGTATVSLESVINTVQVPILLKLAFGSDKFQFFINGGGYGAYALGGTSKTIINGGAPVEEKITFDDNDGRIEYGAVGGAGIQLGIGRAKLLLEGRYNYGLGSNAEKMLGTTASYSRIIMGSVGVLIPLGGR